MPGYVGFYRGRSAECHAENKYKAQQELAKLLKVKYSYDVAVELAETDDGEQVIHRAVD